MPRIAIEAFDAMGAFAAVHESESVKVCGCRPHEGGAARTGPAYANLQRRKPREVWRDDASDAEGIWRL